MRFFANASYRFLQMRKAAYVVSAVALTVGIVSLGFHRGLNYGVDFTGGTLFQIRFEEAVTTADVRDALNAAGLMNLQVQGFGGVNEYLVRLAEFTEGGERELSEQFRSTLDEHFGEDGYTVVRTEAVGPKVGEELQERAIYAVLISFLLTLIYIGFRFEWRFGLAAIIATFHDIILTLGLISVLDIEISLATVAAILTIIGYSLNDTIVIFDRIRENLKKLRKDAYVDILNRSINETLPRTFMTSGTTLAVLLALALFGGPVIRGFTIVLIAGVIIGTYSSIFVASPALLEVERRTAALQKKRGGRRRAAASTN